MEKDNHGDKPAPDPSRGPGAALIIIDMISDMAFDEAPDMAGCAINVARAIRRLRTTASRAGLPVIYVNDNFGEWTSERSRLIRRCEKAGEVPRQIINIIRPRKSDLFIIKPRHSGFYATNLQALLPRMGVSRLILTGMATEMCVLFTAADAHMRDYRLWVPEDCVAGASRQSHDFALDVLERHFDAEVRPAASLALAAWLTD